MWVFLPGGLLMPAALPTMAVDKVEVDPKWTHDGKFDLQVRARVKRHLENFIGMYMEEGTYSDIQATPSMDYNFRFYTTRDDFAWAMGKAIADIDYQKFKPTAETKNAKGDLVYGPESKDYHQVLNTMWGTVTKLGSPGGIWGPYSTTNSNGYKPGELTKWAPPKSPYASRFTTPGDAFTSTKFEDDWSPDTADDAETAMFGIDPDYNPDAEGFTIDPKDEGWLRNALLEEAGQYDVPVRDWPNYFTASEFALIKDAYEEFLKAERQAAKRVRNKRRGKRQATL